MRVTPRTSKVGRLRLRCDKAAEHGAADHNFQKTDDPDNPRCAWCQRTYQEVYP